MNGRLTCAKCGGRVVQTGRGFDCPKCDAGERKQRAREIAAALVDNGLSTATGARYWTTEQSENAAAERETLTAELLALIVEGRADNGTP